MPRIVLFSPDSSDRAPSRFSNITARIPSILLGWPYYKQIRAHKRTFTEIGVECNLFPSEHRSTRARRSGRSRRDNEFFAAKILRSLQFSTVNSNRCCGALRRWISRVYFELVARKSPGTPPGAGVIEYSTISKLKGRTDGKFFRICDKSGYTPLDRLRGRPVGFAIYRPFFPSRREA